MKQEEAVELLNYIEYFTEFIRVMGVIADASSEGGVYEIEAPCRAASHHASTVLEIFLSDYNENVKDRPSSNDPGKVKLTVVGKRPPVLK